VNGAFLPVRRMVDADVFRKREADLIITPTLCEVA
jgi:hypothetical protein